jgi:hypothetical protein
MSAGVPTIEGVYLSKAGERYLYRVSWLVDGRKLLWKASVRSSPRARALRMDGEAVLAAPDAGSAEHAARRAVEAAIDQL